MINTYKVLLVLVALVAPPSYAKSNADLISDALGVAQELYGAYKTTKVNKEQAGSTEGNFKYIDQKPEDFRDSKDWLKEITKSYNVPALYTDCPIKAVRKSNGGLSMKMDAESCGVDVYKSQHRSFRAEAEHISPASYFGRTLPCWANGGRSNCNKTSKIFNIVEADPLNLRYALGNVNADRSNYRFAEFDGGAGVHDYLGNGDVLLDHRRDLFEPPEDQKGLIGRTHLYMSKKYGVPYSKSYLLMMERWSKLPPDAWECKYNDLVLERWGYENEFTRKVCDL